MSRCEDCGHSAHGTACPAEVERTGSTYWGDVEETRVSTCRCRGGPPAGGPYRAIEQHVGQAFVYHGDKIVLAIEMNLARAEAFAKLLNSAHEAGLREAVECLRGRAGSSDQYLDYGPDSNALMSAASALAARMEGDDAK